MDKTIECKQYAEEISDELWRECEPLIANAARYANWEFTTDSVRERLASGEQQLWVVSCNGDIKFVWVTEICVQVNRKLVIVYSAAGEMEYGWKFWEYMSHWMLGNGIDEAEVYCRPSMARLLRRRGLKTRYEVLTIKPFGGME